MGINSNPGTSSSGSALLDRTPASPADKIYSKSVPPGSDTKSLLGDDTADPSEDGDNSSLQSDGNKLMLSQAMFMHAVNLRESVAPGSTPDPIKQWVAEQMNQVPQMAEQMARGGNPGAFLSAVGQQSGGTTPSGPAMGAPAFGGSAGTSGPGQGPVPMQQ